jgi:hypothetical protein
MTAIKQKLDNLLSLWNDMKDEGEKQTAQKTKKVDEEKAAGEEIRGAAVTTLRRQGSDVDTY